MPSLIIFFSITFFLVRDFLPIAFTFIAGNEGTVSYFCYNHYVESMASFVVVMGERLGKEDTHSFRVVKGA